MRGRIVIVGLVLLFVLGCGPRPRPLTQPFPETSTSAVTTGTEATDAVMLSLHNAARARSGLAPLAWDARLATAAAVQARDCAARNVLTHVGSDGSTVSVRTRRAGWPTGNVAEDAIDQVPGTNGPEEAVGRWLRSPGHRANILGPYTHLGTALCDAKTGYRYRVATFGRWP